LGDGQQLVVAGGGQKVVADILIVIRILIFFLWQTFVVPQKSWWLSTFQYWTHSIDKRCIWCKEQNVFG
jgi:hypothetical protein